MSKKKIKEKHGGTPLENQGRKKPEPHSDYGFEKDQNGKWKRIKRKQ